MQMALSGTSKESSYFRLAEGLRWSSLCCFVAFLLTTGLPGARSYCRTLEETAYSNDQTYSYPRGFEHRSSYSLPYDRNLKCKLIFKPTYAGDGVKLRFIKVDLEPPRYAGDYSSCQDKIVVYDGDSESDPVLMTTCGDRTMTVESSGSRLLLVFTTDNKDGGMHYGYVVNYVRIDRGGRDNSTGIGPGMLAAIIVPTLLFYALIFFVIYRRCKYAQNVRRNLAATGHTPEDIRMAMATVVDQASRQPLTSNSGTGNGHDHGHSGSNMNQIFLEHMDANRDRRLARSGGRADGAHSHANRMRHPAGEHSGRASPYQFPFHGAEGNRDVYDSGHSSPIVYNRDGLTVDYQDHSFHHHGQYNIEDDRRSHGSGRSGRSQGQRNPSPRPHSHRGGNPVAYTYYGDIDAPSPTPDVSVTASAPSYHEVAEPPPPSYEEAATGKFDPRPV